MAKTNKDNKTPVRVDIRNRKASHEFHFLENYTAGIMLAGTEVKSVREGKVNLGEAYGVFLGNDLYVRNMHISTYENGTHYNHVPIRDRKLLLQKRELKKLQDHAEEAGLTIVPTRMFLSERGFIKLDIALARGKKLYDKREDLKAKDVKREMERDD